MRSPQAGPAGVTALLAWFGLVACGVGPVGAKAPDPQQVISHPGDVPTDLSQCPGAGPVDSYLSTVKESGPGAHQSVQGAWDQLRKENATAAAVSVFAASPAACSAQLGAGPGRSVASLVAVFPDDKAAAAAYRQGILGFPTPAAEAQISGVTTGVSTGLGDNAWVADRDIAGRALYVAWWQEGRVASFLLTVDLDATESKRAAHAVARRAG